jgi:hypothetical protein
MIRQIYRDDEGEADGADRLGKPFSPASEKNIVVVRGSNRDLARVTSEGHSCIRPCDV